MLSTVELDETAIKKYIKEQEKHDMALDKLSVREYEDPFKDSKAYAYPLRGGKSDKGNGLEHSESQRLETLTGIVGLLADHPFEGWLCFFSTSCEK